MDNIDRIINLLLAIVATGDIAEGYQLQLADRARELMEISDFAETATGNAEKYVNVALGEAIFELAGAEDKTWTLGKILADSFMTGIVAGVAIGQLAAEGA